MYIMDKSVLAKNLWMLRRISGKTQAEWAAMLGVKQGSISKAERDECWPARETLFKIAEMYELKISDLFREDLFRKGGLVRNPDKISVSPDLKETHEIIESNQEFAEFVDTVARLQKDQQQLLYMTARQLAGQSPFLE